MPDLSQVFHAAIIGPPSSFQAPLIRTLKQIGDFHVHVIHSPEEQNFLVRVQPCHLLFVGWEVWPSTILNWLALRNTSSGSQIATKMFLILPMEHSINLVEAIRAGVDGFITYPYSLHNLRQKIQTVLPSLTLQPSLKGTASGGRARPSQKKALSQEQT